MVVIFTVECARAWPPPAGTYQPTCQKSARFQRGAGSWEEVLGRGGEGSRRLMWTRRVEWARASTRASSPRAGGRKFLFLGADKVGLEAEGSRREEEEEEEDSSPRAVTFPGGLGRPRHRSAAHRFHTHHGT